MANTNPQAVELNATIAAHAPAVLDMLSARGRDIFFPSKGILGQSAEAKGKRINATIGIALEDDGSPLRLGCLANQVTLDPKDAFPYAPSFGKPELRELWRDRIYRKNPSLGDAPVSKPVVTCALTHALSMCGYLFLDAGDKLYSPELFWGNYRLVFANGYGAEIATFPTFVGGGFNVAGLRDKLLEGPPAKRVVLLNFPNNPTGYTPTLAEAEGIRDALLEAAEAGNNVVALIDDAYFGLVYEDGIITESIFPLLADLHERILAVKIDGATKEDYAWGFRVGFITYATKGGAGELYEALEAKTAGAVRGNVSNAPHLSQSLLRVAYNSPAYEEEKAEKYRILKRRANKVKDILADNPEYRDAFEPLPFNSGYFMCLQLKDADPEAVRTILLDEYSTGVIAAAGVIRVAFSATPFELLEELFSNLYQAVCKAQSG